MNDQSNDPAERPKRKFANPAQKRIYGESPPPESVEITSRVDNRTPEEKAEDDAWWEAQKKKEASDD